MFDLVFENDKFVVICKHPKVSVHKDEEDHALVSEIEKALKQSKLYLVHRLDKMTSGLLLLAKSSEIAAKLGVEFSQRRVEKYYLAIGSKKPKKKQGLISGDMERSRRSSWKLVSSHNNPAQTQFISVAAGEGNRLFLCKPRTGKTHQIRVALKSIGSPIVGDAIYNPSSEADRGYLHAYCLMFNLDNESYRFVSDPSEQTNLGEMWQSPETLNQINLWNEPENLPWPVLKGK